MKQKKWIIIKIIVIIYFVGYVIFNIISFGISYPTPEEAIMNQRDVKVERVVSILQDGDYAVGSFEYGNTIKTRYLYKNEKGWKMLYNTIFWAQTTKFVDDYRIYYYRHNGNTLINIRIIYEEGKEISTPVDSINSNFKYVKTEKAGYYCSRWFLVLEDMPEDYEITLNGEKVKL